MLKRVKHWLTIRYRAWRCPHEFDYSGYPGICRWNCGTELHYDMLYGTCYGLWYPPGE